MRSRFGALTPVLAVLFTIAIGAAAYAAQASAEPGATEYAEYRNSQFGFSLLVPDDMHASESDADGGQEITFTDPTSEKQFIVTATPYSQLDVTLGREGDPSGTADQPDHLEIVNIRRDDLFRVWFTKDDVLYTIVTMPNLETWLTRNILPTWQFGE